MKLTNNKNENSFELSWLFKSFIHNNFFYNKINDIGATTLRWLDINIWYPSFATLDFNDSWFIWRASA